MIPAQTALANAASRLKAAGIEDARREARLILSHAHQKNASEFLMLEALDPARYEPLLQRRLAREPLAYITGHKEFWSLDFHVSPATLIPRPESETLIEAALTLPPPSTLLDLGTGTGCLLLAALSELPNAFGIGVDRNPAAAELAQKNAQNLGLNHRAAFFAGNWATAIVAKFDLILCNPPYIAAADIPSLMPEVARFEPATALDGGADGLAEYHNIINQLPEILSPDGSAILELGAGQSPSVRSMAEKAGLACFLHRDLSGVERAARLNFRK